MPVMAVLFLVYASLMCASVFSELELPCCPRKLRQSSRGLALAEILRPASKGSRRTMKQ